MQNKMGLFDVAGLELVKKKYYSADKVAELMDKSRAAYEKCTAENEQLRKQLEEHEELKKQLDALSAQKGQISDTLMSAQSLARQIVDDAREQAEQIARLAQVQADEMVKTAEKKAEIILSGAESRKEASDAELSQVQEYALKCVESCLDKLRRQQMEAIEFINGQWQDFLGGLMLPDDKAPRYEEKAEYEKPTPAEAEPADWMAFASMELPDLEEQYADIDEDTFFSGGFFNEQSGNGLFEQLKSMMDSIDSGSEE